MSSEVKHAISTHFALGDLLDEIFRHLQLYDLLNCALVCRTWHEAALRELAKRRPEQLVLPHIFSKVINKNDASPFHVYKLLKAKPYVALLFVGPSTRERDVKNQLEFKVLEVYKKYFPEHLVVVGVDECMVDKNQFTSCDGLLGPASGIPGLFLPKFRDLNFKVVQHMHYWDRVNNAVINLKPKDPNVKSTIIMFTRQDHGRHVTAEKYMEQIKSEFKQKMYTLWGGSFDDHLMAINCKSDKNVATDRTSLFAVCISGSSLESWSTVINCMLKKQEVDKQLTSFKNNLKLKRHAIGLICGPRYVEPAHADMYVNSHELMNALKTIIPHILFTAIFNYGYLAHYGVDSTSDNCDQKLSYKMAMSLMVITYD